VLGEVPRRLQVVGLAVAALGLAGIGASGRAAMPLAGFALTLCAAVAWASGNLVSRSLARHGPVDGFSFVVWAGLIPPIPFFLLAVAVEGREVVGASLRAMDLGSWAAVAYLALAATLVGYGLWNRLLRTYPAAQVARFTLLIPVVGLAAGWALLGERLGPGQLASSALVVGGLAIPALAERLRRPGKA
jgi:O-acetylserine/cysteine efflux transporter